MSVRETREQLEQKISILNKKIAELKQVALCICELEITLTDEVALEEQLENVSEDIKSLAREVLDLRHWLDFEELEESNPF